MRVNLWNTLNLYAVYMSLVCDRMWADDQWATGEQGEPDCPAGTAEAQVDRSACY